MTKPYIQLFRTPNAFYVFDANKNEFVTVSYDSYHYLSDVMADLEEWYPAKNEELSELAKDGYLSSESNVKEIQHSYSKHLAVFLERKLSKITLQLTQDCNFRCKYCIYSEESSAGQRSHSRKKMTWEIAKKAVDFLWARSVDSHTINIGFYGGEPLLEYPLLKKVVEYSISLFSGKKLTFNITSNGTLLNDEIIMFFQKHDIAIMISLDGTKEINDLNRVYADGRGTYDDVMRSIKRVREIAPEYAEKLQINMVIDPAQDYDCYNTVSLENEDISRMNVQQSIVDFGYDLIDTVFAEEFSWKSEYLDFLAILAHWGRYPQKEVSPIAERAMNAALDDYERIANGEALREFEAPSGPCIPGHARLFVNVDEMLLPCERVSETCPAMIIGNLADGFDYAKANAILNIGKITESACKTCWAFRYCSLCVKKADDGSSLSETVKLSHCDNTRNAAYHKLMMQLLLKEVPVFYPQLVRK